MIEAGLWLLVVIGVLFLATMIAPEPPKDDKKCCCRCKGKAEKS